MICPVSSAYTIGVVSFAWPRYICCWLWTGHCFGYLFLGYLFPALFANQILIYFISPAHVSPFLHSLLADFEQVIVPVLLYLSLFGNEHLFFIWVMYIYIILDKGCHIWYVFGLNSTVCSHIIGVHLSSDQVTYYFIIDADLYNSFLLRLRIKNL